MKERKKKVKNLDTNLNIKIDTKLLNEFKDVCSNKNIAYSKVVRDLMKKYIERSENNE